MGSVFEKPVDYDVSEDLAKVENVDEQIETLATVILNSDEMFAKNEPFVKDIVRKVLGRKYSKKFDTVQQILLFAYDLEEFSNNPDIEGKVSTDTLHSIVNAAIDVIGFKLKWKGIPIPWLGKLLAKRFAGKVFAYIKRKRRGA